MSSLVVCCPGPYAVLTKDTMPQTYKRKRSWSRAVFSNLQRKGLEKRFEIQKYVTKPDRKQLAAMLGLTDAQVRLRLKCTKLIETHFWHKSITQKLLRANHSFKRALMKSAREPLNLLGPRISIMSDIISIY